MSARVLFAVIAIAALTPALRGEAPRFRFQKGETLTYHLVQTTKVIETIPDDKTNKPVESESTTKVDLIRKWKTTDVDAKGVATLEMTIPAMRWERKAGKEEDVFDSSNPDDLNKKEMARHVGPVLATLRIDAYGRLLEVKESKIGPAARFATELPFKLVLPDAEPKPGDVWDRSYTIQLDPPLGTGEKYQAVQTYTCQEPRSGLLTLNLTTDVKDAPAQAADQIPLLPLMPSGAVYFQVATGRYYAARLKIEKALKNHQGEGSSYRLVSTYVEDIVPEK
jgi:hypothetical protein